jgi:hypothetical protein
MMFLQFGSLLSPLATLRQGDCNRSLSAQHILNHGAAFRSGPGPRPSPKAFLLLNPAFLITHYGFNSGRASAGLVVALDKENSSASLHDKNPPSHPAKITLPILAAERILPEAFAAKKSPFATPTQLMP